MKRLFVVITTVNVTVSITKPFVISFISVLKFISVLVSIKFFLNHFSISFYLVFRIFSVAVCIQFSLYHFSLNSI
jgi:hypothetical protein